MTRLALACAVLAAAGPQLSAALINYMGGTPNTTNFNPNPNVTAVVPVPGWNLAKPYPGLWVDGENPETAVGQGWTMHLNITANVTSPYGDERKGRVTRQTIELRPPSPPSAGSVFDPQSGEWIVDKNTTDTWAIRLISFTKSKMPPGGRNNKDGSCEGILSKECVDGVTQSLASSPQSQSGNFSNSFLSIGTDKCPFVGWSISCKFAYVSYCPLPLPPRRHSCASTILCSRLPASRSVSSEFTVHTTDHSGARHALIHRPGRAQRKLHTRGHAAVGRPPLGQRRRVQQRVRFLRLPCDPVRHYLGPQQYYGRRPETG